MSDTQIADAAAAAAAAKTASDAAAATAAANTGSNEENKFRRLHEAAETKRAAAEARIAELEAAETVRKQAEMTEVERSKAQSAEALTRAEKAEARAAELERAKLLDTIAAEHSLTPEARKLMTGADEAALRESAVAIAAIMKQPAMAGSNTQPNRGATPSLDERIDAALKAGNIDVSIALKRERAGFAP